MFKAKIIMMTVAAVYALNILWAASASASWFVGGTELKTSAALATAEVIDEVSTMLVPALNMAVVCSGGTLEGVNPEIIAGNSVKAEALKFLGCNITKPPNCFLEEENETIVTTPITAKISLAAGEADRIVYSPQTKSLIATVRVSERSECAFQGEQVITGSVVDSVPRGQLEGVTETLVGLGSVENNSLQVSHDPIFIDGGKALVKLASGSKWSFK